MSSPEAILFVPALGEERVDQSPRLIAEKVVRALRVLPAFEGVGELEAVKIESLVYDPANWKEAEAARILADEQPLYDLYKLDYRQRLDAHRDMGTVRRFFATIGEAIALTLRLTRALSPLSHQKGPTRKQVLAALAGVVLFWLAAAAAGGLVWQAVANKEFALPASLADIQANLKLLYDQTQVTLTTAAATVGLTLAGTAAWLRDAASRYAGAVDYLDHPDANEYRDDVLALARVLRANGHEKIHLVGYSFGGLISLDTLFEHRAPDRSSQPSEPSPFATVVTVGCIFDFVKAFWPGYFRHRRCPDPMPRWVNIYSEEDVLGSKIEVEHLAEGLGRDDVAAIVRQLGYRVSHKPLRLWRYFTGRGFKNHGCYWTGSKDETEVWRLVVSEGLAHPSQLQEVPAGPPAPVGDAPPLDLARAD